MSQSWNGEQDEILIDFVRNREFIYNIKNKDYRNTQRKQNVWHDIGRILNKTAVDCSKRWAYIRDYYIRRRGKPGTGSCGEAAKKRTDLLSFLDSCSSAKRSTITNISPTNTRKYVIDDDTEDHVIEENTEGYDNNTIDKSISSWEEEERGEEQKGGEEEKESREEKETNAETNLRAFKKRKTSHGEERLKLLKEIVQRQAVSSTIDKEDETDLFFSAMARIVKKLPQRDQVLLRIQIGNLVGNAELRYLSSQADNNRTTSSVSSYDIDGHSMSSSFAAFATNETNDYEQTPTTFQQLY